MKSVKAKKSLGLQMKYFVVKPSGVDAYATASRQAIIGYGMVIKPFDPELAEDLFNWAKREAKKAIVERNKKRD